MSNAKDKFIKRLENSKYNILKFNGLPFEQLSNLYLIPKYFLYFLTLDDNTENTVVFTEFNCLSEMLNNINFSMKEKSEIIMLFIEQNIKTDFLNTGKIIVKCDDPIEEKKQAKEILTAHRVIKTSYLDKKDTFNEKDIKKVYLSLSLLGVSSNICDGFRYLLTSNYEKRKARIFNKTIPSSSEKETKILTKKEIYNIRMELNEYYDFDRMEPLKPLSMEEKLKCVSLLQEIGTEKDEIHKFLKSMEYYPRKYTNPITMYLENYEKIKYYERAYGLQEYTDILEECFKEIFLCNSEDYVFWKANIAKKMDEVLKMLPKTFEYELSNVKKK